MAIKHEEYPNGFTIAQMAEILCAGQGVAWELDKTPEVLRDLAKVAKGEGVSLIDHRGNAFGSANRPTRLYYEDQLLIAWLHLMLRETGHRNRDLALDVSHATQNFHGNEWNERFAKGQRERSPAQEVIDLWRAGERGFTFEIRFANSVKDGSREIRCGFAQDGKPWFVPFEDESQFLPSASTTFELDRHLARIFGEAE